MVCNRMRSKAHLVWLVMGLLLIVSSRMLGSISPDIEKLFNGFCRGAWHLYTADNLLSISSYAIMFMCILICVWVAVAYFRRL